MRIDPVGIERNRLIEMPAGAIRIPVEVQPRISDGRVSGSQLRIELEGSRCRRLGLASASAGASRPDSHAPSVP